MINKVTGKRRRNTEFQLSQILSFIKINNYLQCFAFLSYDHCSGSWQKLKFMTGKEIWNFPNYYSNMKDLNSYWVTKNIEHMFSEHLQHEKKCEELLIENERTGAFHWECSQTAAFQG